LGFEAWHYVTTATAAAAAAAAAATPEDHVDDARAKWFIHH
jgi:hypothetical protein